jgi:hypothetical protein
MYYQTTHGKPIVGGHVSRVPSEAFDYIEGSLWLRQVADRDTMTMDPELTHVTRELAYLAKADVRYLVLHREFASADRIDAWADWLVIAPAVEESFLLVYRTDPQCDRDYWLREELAPGVGLFGWQVPSERLHQGAALDVALRWATSSEPLADYGARLELVEADGDVVASWMVSPSPTIPTSQWWDNEVVRGSYRLVLPISVPPGTYDLELTLVEAATDLTGGKTMRLGSVTIDTLAPSLQDDVAFGEEIRLIGHSIDVGPENVAVTLYWRALDRPTASYKMFVHAVAPDTGEILAQCDAIPCNWACPTTQWQPGEVIVDRTELAIPEGSPYDLVLGWYDQDTLERLTPVGSADRVQDNTAIVLAGSNSH